LLGANQIEICVSLRILGYRPGPNALSRFSIGEFNELEIGAWGLRILRRFDAGFGGDITAISRMQQCSNASAHPDWI